MLAVVTTKGQLTLPKRIRDMLGLAAGSQLDFSVNEQGWLLARPVTKTALGLAGLLHRPGRAPVSLAAMDEAVLATAAQLNAPTRAGKLASKTGDAVRAGAGARTGASKRKTGAKT